MLAALAYFAGCSLIGAAGIGARFALCAAFHITIHHEETDQP